MNDEINQNANPLPLAKMEVIGSILFFVGLAFKFAHYPFSGPLTVVSLGTLAIIYWMRSFERVSYEEDEKQDTLVNILAGVSLGISCIGILFRLMYWPGSQNILTIACIGLPIIFCWLFMVRSKVIYKETAQVYFLKLVRVALFFLLAATLYSTSLKTQIDVEQWDDAEMARLKYKHISNPKNVQFKEEYIEYSNSKLKR